MKFTSFLSSFIVKWEMDRISPLPLTFGREDVHSCYTPWFHLMAVKLQASALRAVKPLKSKHLKLLYCEELEAALLCSAGLRQTHPILKGLSIRLWSACVLPPTVFREFASDVLCQNLIALCLIFVKFSKVFPVHLHAVWHLHKYWSHMLLLLMSTSIYMVRTLAFCQKKCAKTKSTAWSWKHSSNTHSSLHTPCKLGFLPSSPDLLLRTELCPTDLFLPCPRPSVATRVLRFALVPASFWTIRLFQNWRCQLQKNLSPVLTAEMQNLGNQPLACRLLAALGNSLVQLVVLFWNAFHPGWTVLSFRTFPMGLGGSVSVPDPDFCNLQIAATFLILQSGTLQHLKY